MESAHAQDGEIFIENVARFIRRHEKALANSLQVIAQRRQSISKQTSPTTSSTSTLGHTSHTSALAAALSYAGISFRPHAMKQAHLTLTPHHLFYLLSKIEELDINVGPMNIRTESIHNDLSSSNYISFLQPRKLANSHGDADSIHSVSSVRSVMSGMSMLWSGIGLGGGSRTEKAKLALEADLKYIYAAFTKLPSLRLTPDHRTALISGYEQFPFDTAVPMFAFKNVQYLEVIDLDFRQLHGWDRLAEQLTWLIIRRGKVDDLSDLLTNIVLDDVEKRRKRSTRGYDAPSTPSWSVPSTPRAEYARSQSDPGSPPRASPGSSPVARESRSGEKYRDTASARPKGPVHIAPGSVSPKRPPPGRPNSSYRHVRTYSTTAKRTGSGSSLSSEALAHSQRADGSLPTLDTNTLPVTKWQKLAFLSLKDNGLTALSARSVAPIAGTLRSFDLSNNLFTEIPESLSSFARLASIDLSNCMIDSLHSLSTTPLPAITTLKLKSNRLQSLSGIERLPALEYVDIRDNKLTDVAEISRLTSIPSTRKVWVKHNPFTRSFSDYRVRIMNYFRKAPGFYEDVIVDDTPASYSERKQLAERAQEIDALGSVRERPLDKDVVVVQATRPAVLPEADAGQAAVPSKLEREVSSSSTRKKRIARRRMVDLSREDRISAGSVELPKDRSVSFRHDLETHEVTRGHPVADAANTHSSTDSQQAFPTPKTAAEDNLFNLKFDETQARIGGGWHAALPKHNWHDGHQLKLQESHPARLIHQTTVPAVINGGRTLG